MAGMPLSVTEQAYADAVEAHGRRVDFWLSYAGRDRDWADWIAWQLVNAGYSVELDAWDGTAGRSPAALTAEALERADRMLMLFSAAYFQQWALASPDGPAGPDQGRGGTAGGTGHRRAGAARPAVAGLSRRVRPARGGGAAEPAGGGHHVGCWGRGRRFPGAARRAD